MQWQVDGEGQTAPLTADLRLATKQVQSAMETTQPAPLSPGCDPVQGESSSDEHKSANKESIVFYFFPRAARMHLICVIQQSISFKEGICFQRHEEHSS